MDSSLNSSLSRTLQLLAVPPVLLVPTDRAIMVDPKQCTLPHHDVIEMNVEGRVVYALEWEESSTSTVATSSVADQPR